MMTSQFRPDTDSTKINSNTMPVEKIETPNPTLPNVCMLRTSSSHPAIASLSSTPSTTSPMVVVRTLTTAPGTPATTSITSGGIKITPLGSQPVKISALPSTTTVLRPAVTTLSSSPSNSSAVRSLLTGSSTVKPESPSAPQSSPVTVKPEASPTPQRNIIREMQVRVPNRRDKRFSVLRFHSSDRPDLSSGLEVFMQRENNFKQYRSVNNINEIPDRGAGSEFGREAKEEARLKKYGIVRESYRPDDQPWVMTVGKGKTGRRRYKGVKEGSVSNNVEYFVFCQCKDGNFDAYPVHAWYKMKPEINYRFLREEEAEVEYSRLNKTMNLFNVMIKRKLTDGDEEDAILDREIGKELKFLTSTSEARAATEGESSSNRLAKDPKSGVGGGVAGKKKSDRGLKLTDLEELDHGSDADDDDDEEDEEDDASEATDSSKAVNKKRGSELTSKLPVGKGAISAAERARLLKKKQRDAAIVSRMRRFVKKRKKKARAAASSSEEDDLMEEAQDESEVDDHEGDEVDYMTNSSSDEEKLSEEEREKIYIETGVDEEAGLKALLTDVGSEDEEEDESRPRGPDDLDDTLDESGVDGTGEANRRRRFGDLDKGDLGVPGSSQGDGPEGSSKPHRVRKKKTDADDAGALSSSSSSSSSIEGDSSSYSSSSSDSEADADEKAKRNSKKAAVFQKLSESIHGSAATASVATTNSSGETVDGSLKRRPLDASDSPTTGTTTAGNSPSSGPPVSKKGRFDGSLAGGSTSTACDSELMSTVRKYLMRKPITVTELLRKIRVRKLVGKNEDAQAALANVLRQLRPIKQIINGQHALSLKH